MIFSRYALLGGVLLLCLSSFYLFQPDLLQTRVSATYQDATLVEVLTDLRDNYDLKFAYLNNELPAEPNITLSVQNAPLHGVLDSILKDTSLSYQLVNGQIVLKKKPKQAETPTPTPKVKTSSSAQTQSNETGDPTATASTSGSAASTDIPEPTEENASSESSTDEGSSSSNSENTGSLSGENEEESVQPEPTEPEVEVGEESVQSDSEIPEGTILDSNSSDGAPSDGVPSDGVPSEDSNMVPSEDTETAVRRSDSADDNPVSDQISRAINDGLDYAIFDRLPDEPPYETNPFHVGIVYPISSNGTEAGRYVNKFSLHLLVGYSAGLDGLEASAFGNIENDFVDGAQFAGFFNVVKNRVEGIQAAGFMNLNGGNLEGAQFAGFLNTNLDSIEGIQGAGFLNLSNGYTQGAQFAGFSNIVTQEATAIQGAGFANITTSDLTGAQFAGFGNYAYQVDGAQFAGFANVATGHVRGFQGSGFINVARTVKGVQLSVFNVADSIDGVPIGFLSIVRKNGYRALEVWGGETMHANVAYKIGVRKFYNIFSFGSQFADADFRYGIGYGIGHITALSPTVNLSIDLIAQQINDSDNPIFSNNQELNLLNSLRLGFSKQYSEHFGLFVGPTFNVLVSEVINSDGTIGSNLPPYTFFDRTYNGRTNVQMWAGVNVGLRF
jgi:hypothetical protein